jgi:hypothetical protein
MITLPHEKYSGVGGKQVIGGTKGHVEETITGAIFLLYEAYDWKMIPRCTGRYTCKNHDTVSQLTPAELLNRVPRIKCNVLIQEFEFKQPNRSDKVHVIALDNENRTGIISYEKEGDQGTKYVHTLNAPSGFRRKLEAIGITVTDSDITYTP